jgi:hypothetical protein
MKLNKFSVGEMRLAGLEAKWGKTSSGAPAMFVRNPTAKLNHQKNKWWMVTKDMAKGMREDGIMESFDSHTFLGDIFFLGA